MSNERSFLELVQESLDLDQGTGMMVRVPEHESAATINQAWAMCEQRHEHVGVTRMDGQLYLSWT